MSTPLRVQMMNTGRGAIRPIMSCMSGGGGLFENSVLPAVIIVSRTCIGAEAPGISRNSPTDREPAPSETTALRSSVSAAAWSISSPPTDSPRPPIRSGSTSGRRFRNSIAALMSFSPSQPKPCGSPSLSPEPRRSNSSTP